MLSFPTALCACALSHGLYSHLTLGSIWPVDGPHEIANTAESSKPSTEHSISSLREGANSSKEDSSKDPHECKDDRNGEVEGGVDILYESEDRCEEDREHSSQKAVDEVALGEVAPVSKRYDENDRGEADHAESFVLVALFGVLLLISIGRYQWGNPEERADESQPRGEISVIKIKIRARAFELC